MSYEKRICVLKQIKKGFTADGSALTGAVYAERLGGELTVTPRIAGIAPLKAGRYMLAVWADGQVFCGELTNSMKISDAPTLARGFAALLCFVRTDAQPVAYGYSAGAPEDFGALMTALEESERKKTKPRSESKREQIAMQESKPKEEEYDDEAIAASNYYRLSKSDENEDTVVRAQTQVGEEQGDGDPCEDEGVPPRPVSRGTLAYYDEVSGRLGEAFAKFPRDTELNSIFPHSEWVRAGSALLGIIYEEGLPRYLCVAAPADSASDEMKAEGVFVPRTHFSDDEGYIIVFQSADTGDYVKPAES